MPAEKIFIGPRNRRVPAVVSAGKSTIPPAMKNHRFSLSLFTAIILIATPLLRAADEIRPDGPRPMGEHRERMGERLADELGLTDDQKARMKAIGDQERSEREALKADTTLSKEDRHAKMKEIHEKYRSQRDAVLTPEQLAKAEKMRGKFEKRRDRMEKRRDRSE